MRLGRLVTRTTWHAYRFSLSMHGHTDLSASSGHLLVICAVELVTCVCSIFFPVFTVLKKRDNAHYPKMTYSIRRLDYRWYNITFRVHRRGCWGILVCLARFMYTITLSEPTLSIWVFGYFISNIYSLLEYLSRKQYWRTQCDSG